jgi:subtilase family serine protease
MASTTRIIYAVDEDIAPIISISYGSCETALDSNDKTTMEAWGAQAVAQGQTIVASSGDSGSTSCFGYTGNTDGGVAFTTAMDQALAVNYPAAAPMSPPPAARRSPPPIPFQRTQHTGIRRAPPIS